VRQYVCRAVPVGDGDGDGGGDGVVVRWASGGQKDGSVRWPCVCVDFRFKIRIHSSGQLWKLSIDLPLAPGGWVL